MTTMFIDSANPQVSDSDRKELLQLFEEVDCIIAQTTSDRDLSKKRRAGKHLLSVAFDNLRKNRDEFTSFKRSEYIAP